MFSEFSRDNPYSPEQFLCYINNLIEDREVTVSFREKRTVEDEYRWIEHSLDLISSGRMIMLVAQCVDQIVGAVAINILPERRDHVAELGISILKDFRGLGLGNYLLGDILAFSQEKLMPTPLCIRVSTFGSNSGAIRFYKKYGFKEVACIPKQFQYGNGYVDEVVLLKANIKGGQ